MKSNHNTKSNRLSFALLVVAVLSIQGQNTAVGADAGAIDAKLAATVRRHFAGSKSYRRGDLITRSQLAEMQSYLRKTRGHGPATRPGLRERALADEAPLVRYFYRGKNSELLRTAAKKTGGYAGLDRLVGNAAGRGKLEACLKTGSVDALVLAISEIPTETSVKRIPRIYTVDEFLAALQEPRKKSDAAAKEAEK